MRITWRGIELPTKFEIDKEISNKYYGRFVVEPFERGFGTTIGNSLRRVLLSSIEGAAVTRVKINGVDHEFTTIPGVLEDVTDIIINIKKIVLKLQGSGERKIKLSAKKKGPVTADMIETDPYVEIVNKDHVIFSLTEDKEVEMEMTVQKGRGYWAVKDRIADMDRFDQEVGNIEVDALFSPIVRVRYNTEDTRVGQRTNYDKLILEVWTDGTVTPQLAVIEAAKILRKHINPFTHFSIPGEEVVDGELVVQDTEKRGEDEELNRKLDMPIGDLELSVRAGNCLESIKLQSVRDLVRYNESDLLKVRSFGKTSLREIKRKLEELGLSLGMDV
ncbi:DNA-directed RNA polymerase subunit alpha [Sedimentisphaera cyanobacteriorum]|uniref:DNA-directed RNA polymerase subunit alpha n=1 Tax=Sedimentisphaera cyanobacteriorum TaxID=1940790 RepID=A0A1Q2HQ73_9BACT|nr:DNA-directed RNA polymerase subunit alpha [Sedimentisphaera cyanobacteriorum]AQQ09406.1 DNA-directed RNA polymerase subunit alpha [Sedimentisphaera cyanobacteriorum]